MKGVSFHFHENSLFLCKRLISTAEATSFPGFFPTRLSRSLGWVGENPGNEVATKTHFYGGGVFLRGGVSLRRKCISMQEVNLEATGL